MLVPVVERTQAALFPALAAGVVQPVKIAARILHKSERHLRSSHGKSGIQSLNSSSERTIILGSTVPSLIEPGNKC